ncbi:MAG: hypothetical protein GY866_14535 [Proteobacteria bacterium]|nr:hypothetical protein [Pseudomonadota bacterium]
MKKNAIMEGMTTALLDLDKAAALGMTNSAIENKLDLVDFIQQAMAPAMEKIGDRFQKGEVFLPHLVMAGDIFEEAMAALQPELVKTDASIEPRGRVVIGTVKGDVHSIGKSLVAILLKTGGFEVLDLGVDIPVSRFIEEARKMEADIIALSALLSTTLPVQSEIIDVLKQKGLKDKYKVLIGGAAASRKFADDIGADGYGENAMDAVRLAKQLCA